MDITEPKQDKAFPLFLSLILFLIISFSLIFQNLKVSSELPETIVHPSGDIDKYKALFKCPFNSAILFIFG